MRFLSTILIFAGYSLVYASVANQGKFATEPWAGLFTDAYSPSNNPVNDGHQHHGSDSAPHGNGSPLTGNPNSHHAPSPSDLANALAQTQAGMSGGG